MGNDLNSENAGGVKSLAAKNPVNHSARRINSIAERLKIQSYLEIGVNRGLTFFNISIPERTAVDPKFIFDKEMVHDKNISLAEMASDDFFKQLSLRKKYDLIFIDGLHTFEQTYRDLCNSLLHSHENTILLIDDTQPTDVYSALSHQGKAIRFRKNLTGNESTAWHGDVYKVVFAIHDFHPGLNYRTIVGSGNVQTLVWLSKQGFRKPLFNSLEKISRLSYFDLLEHIDILRHCGEGEAIDLCLAELMD